MLAVTSVIVGRSRVTEVTGCRPVRSVTSVSFLTDLPVLANLPWPKDLEQDSVRVLGLLASERTGRFPSSLFFHAVTSVSSSTEPNSGSNGRKSKAFLRLIHSLLLLLERVNTLSCRSAHIHPRRERKKHTEQERAYLKFVTANIPNRIGLNSNASNAFRLC